MKSSIQFAQENDVPSILQFIQKLAEFEKLELEVEATEEKLRETLFGESSSAEVILIDYNGQRAGFALFFHNYSTFLAKPGIYLEDLFILPEFRSLGLGRKLLSFLARLALERNCGRLEWSVLNWNQRAIDFYLSLGSKPQSEWTVHRITGQNLVNLANKN